MADFNGKVALVTGAGSGFGREISLRLARAGAAVACVDIDETKADETAQLIKAVNGNVAAISADVSSPSEAARMATEALAQFGSVDLVFANAGIAGAGTAADTSIADWQRVIGVNLTGVWLTSKYLLPTMIARGSGAIVNTASVGGLVGVPGIFSYAAAKGGVVAMTKQMAVDYGPAKIRVNAICPGAVLTPLVRRSFEQKAALGGPSAEQLSQGTLGRYPLGRLGEVGDVAALAVFLASDEAGWITGGIYPVDGGYTAR